MDKKLQKQKKTVIYHHKYAANDIMCKYDDDNTINNNKTMTCTQVGLEQLDSSAAFQIYSEQTKQAGETQGLEHLDKLYIITNKNLSNIIA